MADNSGWGERYQQRRGKGTPNPIKLSKLKIRLVYPPHVVIPTAKITDRPAKNIDYTLVINGKKPYKLKGKTNGDGVLEKEVPPGVKSATLTLHMAKEGEKKKPAFWKIQLEIGDLPSVHEWSLRPGTLPRLNNLGLFASGGPNEDDRLQSLRARSRFVALFGVPDDSVIEDRIKEVYGS